MSVQFSYELMNASFVKARITYETGYYDKKLYIDPLPDISIDEQLTRLICKAAATLTVEMYKWVIDMLDTIEIINSNTNEEYYDFEYDYTRYFKAAIEAGNTKVAENIYEGDYINIRRQSDAIMLEYLMSGQLLAFKVALCIFGHGITYAELIKHDIPSDTLEWYTNVMAVFYKLHPSNRDYLLF